jgi:hypothetical protein
MALLGCFCHFLPHLRLFSPCLYPPGQSLPRGLAADEWPDGCLGYAVNLVRPALSATRSTVMFAQVST